jgi:ribosome-associated protein
VEQALVTAGSLVLARQLAQICHDFKAEDLVVLDVRELTGITDAFVLGTCVSARQIRSLAEELRLTCKRQGVQALSIEGLESAWWVLLDFGDAVVHLFQAEARRYYDLEILWGDAPRVTWDGSQQRA